MAIEYSNVHKAFGAKVVLAGIDLRVEERETLAVIGRSGAGKSVLLKHVVRLLLPDQGAIRVDGHDVGGMEDDALLELRANVGYVFQFAALFDSMTIRENVGMGLRRRGDMADGDIEARVKACLEVVELEGLEERFPAELSGGQKKRAGLARAIATQPDYLLYDEPTSGLDSVTRTVIERLVLRMRDQLGATSIIVTHDLDSAYRVADRIALLHDGRIHFAGTPDEFRASDDRVVRGFVEGRPELLEETL